MRSLEECQAEIFRRSEEKIRKRRKIRNSCLLAALPACLCAAVLLLGIRPENADNTVQNIKIAAPDPTVIPTTQPVIQDGEIRLSSVSVNNRLLDGEGRDARWDYINGLFLEKPPQLSTDQTTFLDDEQLKSSGVSAAQGHTICFVFSDGATVTYYLQEGILTQDGTEKRVTISAKELKILYEMFEISEESGGKK